MVLTSITEFIGHLHPVVIHLPLGILLFALFMQWLALWPKYAALNHAVAIALLAGACMALVSCITGYLLSISDDYDKNLLGWHMWMGICTALVSFMLYAKQKNPAFGVNKTLLSFILLALLFITGHLGGSLTHGSDYFTKPLADVFGSDTLANKTIKPIANVQEAVVYQDVAAPILQAKCYSCHGPNKQKGGLRLSDTNAITKGGKDGVVIKPGNGEGSELIKRMLLPLNDDDHMPPKEKTQPTVEQIALLHWWIDNGANYTAKVKQLNQPANIKLTLTALQKPTIAKQETSDIPQQPTQAAPTAVVGALMAKGIVVLPVAQNSHYLMVNFVTDTIVTDSVLALLAQLKQQIVWLKINNTNVGDAAMGYIAQLAYLTRLNIAHTFVTDKGLKPLAQLQNLHYLNLAGTAVSSQGLLQLKKLRQLQNIYLYQTHVKTNEFALLKGSFPRTTIDTGGYVVPTLQTDTTQVKAKKEY